MPTSSTLQALIEEAVSVLEAISTGPAAGCAFFAFRQQDVKNKVGAAMNKATGAGLVYPAEFAREGNKPVPGQTGALGFLVDVYTRPVLQSETDPLCVEMAEEVWAYLDGHRPASTNHAKDRIVARSMALVADRDYLVWRVTFEVDRWIAPKKDPRQPPA